MHGSWQSGLELCGDEGHGKLLEGPGPRSTCGEEDQYCY